MRALTNTSGFRATGTTSTGQHRRSTADDQPSTPATGYCINLLGRGTRLRAEGGPDIAVLGLGTDGHTASIFDHARPEGVCQRVIATTYHGQQRVSLGLAYLRAVPTRILLATGTSKSAALAAILNPAPGAAPVSAAVVLGQDGYVLADAAAHPGQV